MASAPRSFQDAACSGTDESQQGKGGRDRKKGYDNQQKANRIFQIVGDLLQSAGPAGVNDQCPDQRQKDKQRQHAEQLHRIAPFLCRHYSRKGGKNKDRVF